MKAVPGILPTLLEMICFFSTPTIDVEPYAALFQILGYFISTLLAATVILLIFRVKKIWAYPVVYAAAVAIWAGFTFLLSVRLP